MKKILTIILDGFGMSREVEGNAIRQALTPNFNKLWDENPHCYLEASGETVGLPAGQMGNSEVGHSTIGAGRKMLQEELRIDNMFEINELDDNEGFKETIEYINDGDKTVHLMILASDGGVHSNISHLLKMLEKLKSLSVQNIYLHLITDGRDTDVHSSLKYIETIEETAKNNAKIATICGRYYAMDRDNNFDRIKKYYDLVIRGIGIKNNDIKKSINACYEKNMTDEFLPPILIDEEGTIKNNDILFWLNFRTDRAKEILTAISNPNFDKFATIKMDNLKLITMLPVDKLIKSTVLIEPEEIKNPLGIYLSNLGLTQARIAETEKFAHVTYFFDNEYSKALDNCDRFLIPSPSVATYDMKPEMSAIEVCKRTVACMEKDYDFILVNFANPDMVGHTGNLTAAIKAVQIVDLCLGKLIEAAEENFYTIVLLADHGNADKMLDEYGNPCTTHTTALVPFIINDKKVMLEDGDLSNVAPTILEYMDIAVPEEMKETKSLFTTEKKKEIADPIN